ncbi:MAG: LytTR family DNA-binding domain-containing protein [Verrucomicrobia bacterium]|jgi:two-component system LytT family response regulator|nr:LytTR family DNA-binding domain-containing protein [Verrucomicrobiota bacterium]
MNIRTIIVDDEPLARERIQTLLKSEQDFELVAQCVNGADGLEQIRRLQPDLVFLDIQMPGMDGFELVKELGREKGPSPLVIFVTAYDQHAIKAFEVHALDYLLKPFKQTRFLETLARVRQQVAERQTTRLPPQWLALLEQAPTQRERISRIAVRVGDRTLFVKTSEIDSIEAAGNYVVLQVGKENHVVRETLTALEASLDPHQFIRISRSALVNIDQIKELQPMFKGDHAVILRNGKQLTMTRGLREVQELLKFS